MQKSVPVQNAPSAIGNSDLNFPVTLHYLESSPIVARGPSTGRRYEFSKALPDQLVDSRDAEHLLRTGFFRRAF
jgi:hypothetical protein